MKIQEIFKNIETVKIIGSTETPVYSLSIDSRNIEQGGLFFAVSGTKVDGHLFIDKAVENGAVAVVCEKFPENISPEVTYIQVDKTQDIVGLAAKNFFQNDFSKIKVVGVTGTNGKTTVATMLYQLFTKLGFKSGLLSTVENIIVDQILPATHTTGDAIQIQENISRMIAEGCGCCFMEVSSHSVDQKRISGIDFAGGIFTNLTQDHLDYHQTMDAYAKTKKAFFDMLPQKSFVVYNCDDDRGSYMVADTRAKMISYGHTAADFVFVVKKSSAEGLELIINSVEVKTSLVGEFNAYNVVAVFATGVALGIEIEDLISAISDISGARGRMEKVTSANGIFGIVDYAHTPDALKNTLETINSFKQGRVIVVFGAGGDRDKTKRPLMGKVAAQLADYAIVTSDNPRNENPEDIISDILAGIPDTQGRTLSIRDRKEAIKKAVEMASPGDIIFVAGKGHEDYQEVAGVKSHFSDLETLKEFLS